MEESDDPFNEYRQATSETCLQSVLPDYRVTVQSSEINSLGNEIYDIAPGENRHPVSLMSFPVLFPQRRFGYMAERNIKLSPVLWPICYQFRIPFFAQFVIEQKKVADSINIALKKVKAQTLTTSQIKSDVNKLKT